MKKRIAALLAALSVGALAGTTLGAAEVNMSFGFTFNAWDSVAEGPSTNAKTGYGADNCENFLKFSANGKMSGMHARLWYGNNFESWTTAIANAYSNLEGDGGDGTPLTLLDVEAWVRPIESLKITVGNNLGYGFYSETINWCPIGNRVTGSLGFIAEYLPSFIPGLTVGVAQMFNDMGTSASAFAGNTTDQELRALGQTGLGVKYAFGDFSVGGLATINDSLAAVGGSYANSWRNWSAGLAGQYTGAITVIAGASVEMVDYLFYCVQPVVFVSGSVGPVTYKLADSVWVTPSTVIADQFANLAKLQLSMPIVENVAIDLQVKHLYNRRAGDGNGYNWWGSAEKLTQGGHALWAGTSVILSFGEASIRPGFYIDMDLAGDTATWYAPISFNFNF